MKELHHVRPGKRDEFSVNPIFVAGPHENITNTHNIVGNCTYITGDARNLTGDVTGLATDVSGLSGDCTYSLLYGLGKLFIGDITPNVNIDPDTVEVV
jgi:hypothetical protein